MAAFTLPVLGFKGLDLTILPNRVSNPKKKKKKNEIRITRHYELGGFHFKFKGRPFQTMRSTLPGGGVQNSKQLLQWPHVLQQKKSLAGVRLLCRVVRKSIASMTACDA